MEPLQLYFPYISTDWTLPPLSPDAGTVWPSIWAFYQDLIPNQLFQTLFVAGFIGFYLLALLGHYIHEHFVPLEQRHKIQKEQFAGNLTSLFHSLMISLSAAAVTVSYRTPMDAYNASPTDPGLSIRVYQWVSVLSVSYFMLDALLIAIYYNQSVAKKASFAVHHCAVAVGLSCILVTHPFMAYVSAMWLLTELSTVVLNVRIFARIWSIKWLYMVTGIGVIISYPVMRLIWTPYITWAAWNNEHLDHLGAPGAAKVVMFGGCFVSALSAYYYFAVILANPRKVLFLRMDKHGKNC